MCYTYITIYNYVLYIFLHNVCGNMLFAHFKIPKKYPTNTNMILLTNGPSCLYLIKNGPPYCRLRRGSTQ